MRTDAGSDRARDIAVALERQQSALSSVFFECAEREAARGVEVDVLASRSEYEQIAPRRTDGVTMHELDGIVAAEARIVLPEDAWESRGPSLLLHELVHVYVAACFPEAPPWLHEGLATTYETLEVRSSEIVVGRAPFQIGNFPTVQLVDRLGPPLYGVPREVVPRASELVRLAPAEFYASMDDTADSFGPIGRYAGAWGLVHRLALGPDPAVRERFARYLTGLRDAEASEDVLFATTLAPVVDRVLDEEVGSRSDTLRRYPLDRAPEVDATVEPMSPGAAHLLLAMLAIQSGRESAREMRDIHLAAAAWSDDAGGAARIASIAAAASDPCAEAEVREALDLYPGDRDVLRASLALALLRGAAPAEIARLVRGLATRHELAPQDRVVVAEAFRRTSRPSSALRFAMEAVRDSPGSPSARLAVAGALLDLERYALARRAARIAANLAGDRQPSIVRRASELIATIDAREPGAEPGAAPVVAAQDRYLSPEEIMHVVREHQAEIRACYEENAPGTSGRVEISWRIDLSGAVSEAHVVHSTLEATVVVDCIVEDIRRWQFPSPRGGEVTVQFPFIFGHR